MKHGATYRLTDKPSYRLATILIMHLYYMPCYESPVCVDVLNRKYGCRETCMHERFGGYSKSAGVIDWNDEHHKPNENGIGTDWIRYRNGMTCVYIYI